MSGFCPYLGRITDDHSETCGDQFCIFCLRKRGDDALQEVERLRDVLKDIAEASRDMCDQTPFWARRAICTHEKYERNSAGKMQCAWCWELAT